MESWEREIWAIYASLVIVKGLRNVMLIGDGGGMKMRVTLRVGGKC